MDRGVRDPPSLLGQAPRGHAARAGGRTLMERTPDLGDLVVVLLASTLVGLRDRLAEDGFSAASDLVADLVDIADEYLTHVAA